MLRKEQVSRRQFVKRAAVVTGVTATAATLTPKVNACPIFYDSDGNIADWFCIVDIDDSNPIYTRYIWENCRTGEQSQTVSDPGVPLGDCSNAPNDASCYQGLDIEEWDQFSVGGSEFRIMPNTTSDAVVAAISNLNSAKA